jgi:gp16 family phage-associated protein
MSSKSALTPDKVRQHFRQRGLTFTQWAKDQGYPLKAVYRVLNGVDKANFGRAHEIAVALGLKIPDANCVLSTQYANRSTTETARNPQRRQAA